MVSIESPPIWCVVTSSAHLKNSCWPLAAYFKQQGANLVTCHTNLNTPHSWSNILRLINASGRPSIDIQVPNLTKKTIHTHPKEHTRTTDIERWLMEKNETIRQEFICQICFERDANIVFLPCGHLLCCHECATAIRLCPICREQNIGFVQINSD